MRRPACVLPLDDVLASSTRTTSSRPSLDYDTWDGKLWGIPYRIETHGVIYNKGAFKAAGLDPDKPPQTWTELVDAAKKLTGKGANGQDQFGFAITGGGEFGNTVFRSLPFIWMNGGSIISDDMKKATVNAAGGGRGGDVLHRLPHEAALSPPSTLQNDGTANRRLFIAETVAMYQSGQFDVGSIRKENPNIDIGVMMIPHPEGKETAAILGGWSFIIPKDAQEPGGDEEVRRVPRASPTTWASSPTPSRRGSRRWSCRASRIRSSPMFKEMLPYRPHGAAAQELDADHAGLFRRRAAILLGDADAAGGDGRRRRGNPGAAGQ